MRRNEINSNKKKIISILLWLMASISSSGAMKQENNSSTKSTAGANTDVVSNKRNQDDVSVFWNVAGLIALMETANEIGSNLPGVKKITHPFIRQRFSNYRIRSNVWGDFYRLSGPHVSDFCYKIFNEENQKFYRVAFAHRTSHYEKGKLNYKFKNLDQGILREKLYFATFGGDVNLRFAMEDQNGNSISPGEGALKDLDTFIKSEDYTVDDAADAVNKAIQFAKIIDSNKTPDEKVNLINNNEKLNVVCAPMGQLLKKVHCFRIFVKERKNAKGEVRKIFVGFEMTNKQPEKDGQNI